MDTEAEAKRAEMLLRAIVPDAMCIPQEWDSRIDCLVRLPDGSVVGEMVRLGDISESRLKEAGERLRLLSDGADVALIDEVRSPTRIV